LTPKKARESAHLCKRLITPQYLGFDCPQKQIAEGIPGDQRHWLSAKPTPLFEQSGQVELPDVKCPFHPCSSFEIASNCRMTVLT